MPSYLLPSSVSSRHRQPHQQYIDSNNNNCYTPNANQQSYHNNNNYDNNNNYARNCETPYNPPPPYQTQTVETYPASNQHHQTFIGSNNNQCYKSSNSSLRPRYPQLPPYSNNSTPMTPNLYHGQGGPSSSSFYSNMANFNTSSGSNCGRSNCFSPTYMGLTEVLASHVAGSTVLCLEPKRPSNFWKNFKLKHLLLIFLAIILISILGFVLINFYLNFGKATTVINNSGKGGTQQETSRKIERNSQDFKAQPKKSPSSPTTTTPTTAAPIQRDAQNTERPAGKYSRVVFSTDDTNDDEVFIEDVFI